MGEDSKPPPLQEIVGATIEEEPSVPLVTAPGSVRYAVVGVGGATRPPTETAPTATTPTTPVVTDRRPPSRWRARPPDGWPPDRRGAKPSTSRPPTSTPSTTTPTRLEPAAMTRPAYGTWKSTRSAVVTTYGVASGEALASPWSTRAVDAPSGVVPTTRWVTRTPAGVSTLTTSPTARSRAGTARATARSPTSIAGDIDPETSTSGVSPRASEARAQSRHSDPARAPAVRPASTARCRQPCSVTERPSGRR